MNISTATGLIHRSFVLKLFFEQFPNSSVNDAMDFMVKNKMPVHKTLAARILKNSGQKTVTTKQKPKNNSSLRSRISSIVQEEIQNCLAESNLEAIIQSKISSLIENAIEAME